MGLALMLCGVVGRPLEGRPSRRPQAPPVYRGTGDITLSPVYMWQSPDGEGELKLTDTATGGTIQSHSGGTLPAFPIEVDPSPYVTDAMGTKSDWTAQFRNSTKGTWTRLSNGNFQFTPGPSAGVDQSEYRVSDDGGATWSAWQLLETLVLARSLAPGPYFLIEDYGGTAQTRLNAARNAAQNAGGGTVTTLARSITYKGITRHQIVPNVHYLFLQVKRPNSTHSSGVECSASGNGQGSGWSPDGREDVFNAETGALAGGNRVSLVGVTIDGNAFEQAIRAAYKPSPAKPSQYGRCWPGDRANSTIFNIQHMACIGLKGSDGTNAAARAKLGLYGCYIFDSPADGLQGTGASDAIVEDCRFYGCFRGGIVFDFGNSVLRARRNVFRANLIDNIGCGIDHEILGHGTPNTWYQDILHEDDNIGADFDFNIRQNSVHVYAGCTIGPGLAMMAKGATGARVTWQGSARNPRGTVYYHRKAPASSNEYPRSSIMGWGRVTPHNCTFKFVDQDFRTWGGGKYVYHAFDITPGSGETWEIQLGQTVDTSSAFVVWLQNCTVGIGPGTPSGTYRLFRTIKSLNTNAVVRLDGLTIAPGFQQAAVQLNGQRLEYRNVMHQGYPSASIQQICPGAGQYIAL
jgi:Right handed beta helix region